MPANRLSEDGRHLVLLVEDGGAPKSMWIDIPAGFSKLLVDPVYNWRFTSEPEPATYDRQISIPRGKGLGGSTLINGMIWVRGQARDVGQWAQKGAPAAMARPSITMPERQIWAPTRWQWLTRR